MSTHALPAPPDGVRITAARVLRSEWHKLRTLRSTWITLLTAAALTFGVGLVMGVTYTPGGGDGDMDVVVLVMIGVQFSQLAYVVLGVLSTASEYSTGAIRASLTAVPRRTPVLWAKAAVLAAVTFALSLVTALVTFGVAQIFLAGTEQEASFGDPGVLRGLAGSAAGLTLIGLIALALGALLRSVPGAIGAVIGGVMVLPEVIAMVPYDVVGDAVRYFPAQALTPLMSATTEPGAVSPGAALLALVLWAAVALSAAAALLGRRDV